MTRAALLTLLMLGAGLCLHEFGHWLLAHPLQGAGIGALVLGGGKVLFSLPRRTPSRR